MRSNIAALSLILAKRDSDLSPNPRIVKIVERAEEYEQELSQSKLDLDALSDDVMVKLMDVLSKQ